MLNNLGSLSSHELNTNEVNFIKCTKLYSHQFLQENIFFLFRCIDSKYKFINFLLINFLISYRTILMFEIHILSIMYFHVPNLTKIISHSFGGFQVEKGV